MKTFWNLYIAVCLLLAAVALAIGLSGCARFNSTIQEQTTNGTVRLTRASAWTFFSAKSDLAKFAATQGVSATRQSIGVAALAQSSEDPLGLSGTNLWNGLGIMLGTFSKTALKP
jgi:hypothetical protein